MSSACVLVQQPSLGAVLRPCPQAVSSRSDTSSSQRSLWRPWMNSPEQCRHRRLSCPYSRASVPGSLTPGKVQSFQHPVRLFWPKKKSFDYLYSDGEALLRNFPVQATINFYEESDCDDDDDDDDDDEEEDWEEEDDSEPRLKPQSYFTHYN
ncbi:protein ripply3 [Cynoglossus semilaevis]|uniref:Ripply transcriptional repressor 1 n=1 Tax=Cynoglossus semilaevis TaxID=244447 RepID=A0A3P8VAM5_CYNSE|nr:protein ripply1 [Cynoglossus semilaevis]